MLFSRERWGRRPPARGAKQTYEEKQYYGDSCTELTDPPSDWAGQITLIALREFAPSRIVLLAAAVS